jgi:hypothetical protein|tara:strand:- start:271 stop:459 length:189 start_codon:yes stop_codon:yes gene_type:complete
MVLIGVIINLTATFSITFHEALETAPIVGILANILKIGSQDLNKYPIVGALGAVVTSITAGG